MEQPKFSIGQQVKFVNDPDSEAGAILSFSFTPDTGYTYVIFSKSVDLERKEVLDGVKHLQEDEIVAMEVKAHE